MAPPAPSPAAKPLNVTPSATPAKQQDATSTTTKGGSVLAGSSGKGPSPADISSPHELTAFVESLLEQLDSNFEAMSSQILERMSQMSQRVDSLEASIQDIINGDIAAPASSVPPSPGAALPVGTPGSTRRTGSGYLSRGE